jgi:hypothetical protein
MPMGFSGETIADHVQVVHGLGPVAPSSSTPDYICLKDVQAVEIVITGLNGSTVTGSAITVLQATDASAGSAKALAFTDYYANTDTAASSAMAAATASSNTFTTTNTNSKSFIYRIPINPATLDLTNNFDYIRAATANAVNSTICVTYNIVPKYSGDATLMPDVIS